MAVNEWIRRKWRNRDGRSPPAWLLFISLSREVDRTVVECHTTQRLYSRAQLPAGKYTFYPDVEILWRKEREREVGRLWVGSRLWIWGSRSVTKSGVTWDTILVQSCNGTSLRGECLGRCGVEEPWVSVRWLCGWVWVYGGVSGLRCGPRHRDDAPETVPVTATACRSCRAVEAGTAKCPLLAQQIQTLR